MAKMIILFSIFRHYKHNISYLNMSTCDCCDEYSSNAGCLQCRFTLCSKCLKGTIVLKDTLGHLLICSKLCLYVYEEETHNFIETNDNKRLTHAQLIKDQTKIYNYHQRQTFKKSIIPIIKQFFINDLANIIMRLI